MRLVSLIFILLLSLTGFSQGDHAPGNSFEELFGSSSDRDASCYRIPALVTATNGDLIAAIDERVSSCSDLRSNDNINIVIRRSIDNGQSWSDIETIIDFPIGQSASDPSMIVDKKNNQIFLFYNYMDLTYNKDKYFFHYVKSTDHGKSWSKPIDITSQISLSDWGNDFKFITSGRGIQTKDGTLLHCLVNLERGMHVFGSKNFGKTWFLIRTPIQPADESKIVELADGSWMINSRVTGQGYRHVHVSSDKGKTWKSYPDTSLIDPQCNASIIRYTLEEEGHSVNRLLFANANSATGRTNMTVRVSYDEGKNMDPGQNHLCG